MVIPVAESKSKPIPAAQKKTLIHVLHVDDEPGFLKTTKQILEGIGPFKVESALSVKEAMEKMEEKGFDVIISDYKMPEKNGLEFLRELRKNENTIPLILFTGKGREEVAIEALNLGASFYCNKMGKPQTVYGELTYSIQQVFEKKKAEEALHRETEMLEVVTQNVGAGLTLISKDYRILWANRVITDIFGDVEGKTCYVTYHRRTSVCPGCGIKEIFKTGKRVVHEQEALAPDGQKIWLEIVATPIRDEKGNITSALEFAIDITERKKMEQELKKSEERYRKQFEEAMDAIFVGDAETGILVDCNRVATELVGRKKSEIIGKHQQILHPPEESNGIFSQTFKQHLKEKEGKVLETQIITKSGEIRDVAIKANIFEVKGKRYLQGIFRDITERKKMKEALQESEEKFRLMLEQAPDLIVTIDDKGIVTSCNAALERGTDYYQHEIIGKHFIETPLLHGIDPAHAQKLFNAIIEEKNPKPLEITWFLKDGTPRISEVRIGLMKNDGKITGFTAIARDITERKQAEENLEKSEKEKRAVLDSMSELVIHQDLKHRILWVNKKAADSVNIKAEQLKGHYCYDMWAERANPCAACPIEETLKTSKPQRGEMTTPDGRIWSINSSPLRDENGKVTSVVEVVTNITEQKKTEEALRKSGEKYRELINGMNDTAWVIDSDCGFIDVNDAAVKVLGYSREELLSMKVFDIDFTLDPEEIRGLVKGMPADEAQVFETAQTTKDGKTIPVEISSSLVTYQGKQAILSIARDITERKQAEEAVDKMVNDLSMVIEKLGVVGEATRHDARNKLSVIANNVYLAKQRLTDDHGTLEYLNDIESAVGQIEEIFDFARTYEMIGVEERSDVDVETSVNEAAMLLSDLGDAKLVNECHGLTVQADSQLRQVFYNLMDNSLRHGEKVSQIRVYYERVNDQLKLVYEDDGVGIPKPEKEKIFEEGFGKGTGYGLYLIRKICESYGWTIQETGRPGKGAQFTIRIPKKNKNGKMGYQLH